MEETAGLLKARVSKLCMVKSFCNVISSTSRRHYGHYYCKVNRYCRLSIGKSKGERERERHTSEVEDLTQLLKAAGGSAAPHSRRRHSSIMTRRQVLLLISLHVACRRRLSFREVTIRCGNEQGLRRKRSLFCSPQHWRLRSHDRTRARAWNVLALPLTNGVILKGTAYENGCPLCKLRLVSSTLATFPLFLSLTLYSRSHA